MSHSFIFRRITRPSSLVPVALAAVLGLLALPSLARAAVYTYTLTNEGTVWGSGRNWSSTPVSSFDTELIFRPDAPAWSDEFPSAVTNTNNNNLSDFRVNKITLTGTASEDLPVSIGISGGALRLEPNSDGDRPQIRLDAMNGAGTGTVTYTISNRIILGDRLSISGDGTATFRFTNEISGAYRVSKSGTSTVIFSGASTYTGGTSISGGTLVIAGQGYLPRTGSVTVGNDSTLRINIDDPLRVGTVILVGGSITGPGELTGSEYSFDAGTVFVPLNGDESVTLVKDTWETVTLNGHNTYLGATTVNDGQLLVNGSITSVATVKGTAILGGDGILSDVILEAGAKLRPINTLQADTLTWAADATLVYNLGAGTSDHLHLLGDLTKGTDGIYAFTFEGADWEFGQTYTLITFDGVTTFTAADFSFTNTDDIDGTFTVTEDTVQFTTSAVPEPATWALIALGAGALLLRRRTRV